MADYIDLLPYNKPLAEQMQWDRDAVVAGKATAYQTKCVEMFDSPWSITKWFNDWGMPIPNIFDSWLPYDRAEANVPAHFEFWTAIIEWPPFSFAMIWAITNSIVSTLGVTFFLFKYLQIDGFEGFSWNVDKPVQH